MSKRKKTQQPTARRVPWCRDCSDDFCETCVEQGHKPWTQKMLCMDQAAERAGKEANAGIKEEWPQDVGQLKTHLVELRAAVTLGTDCAAALDATAGVVDKVPQLEACAHLVDAKGQLRVELDQEGGPRWRASVSLRGGDHHVARQLLLQLQPEAELEENQPPPPPPPLPAVEAACTRSPDAVDLGRLTGDEVKELSENRRCYQKIRRLTGVNLASVSDLLHRVHDNVKELEIKAPKDQHLKSISRMRQLRRLDLTLGDSDFLEPCAKLSRNLVELRLSFSTRGQLSTLMAAVPVELRKLDLHCREYWIDDEAMPDLPAKLEELQVENCSTQIVPVLQRLPRLRRLALLGSKRFYALKFPAELPSGHRGLEWLDAAVWDASLESLIKAHAATLQELRVRTATVFNCCYMPFHEELDAWFKGCRLPALRRVVLVRTLPWKDTAGHVHAVHEDAACREQMSKLRGVLGRSVAVLCSVCDGDGAALKKEEEPSAPSAVPSSGRDAQK